MTRYQFNQMNEMEKTEVVWKGVFIGKREDTDNTILLYEIDSLYVEVYFNKDCDEIRSFQSFSSTDQLGPYLEQIDLKGMF